MKSGLSLAMNSANSVTTNRMRKIHNDQWPRRFALKFCQRRMLIGDSATRRRSGGTTRPSAPTAVVSGVLPLVRASTSHLPRLEIDARINPGIGEIGDQGHDHADQRENISSREHDWIVAIEHALEAQKSKPVEREDRFDQQRTGEEGADECARESGDDEQHGVTEDMTVKHLALGAAFGAGGE